MANDDRENVFSRVSDWWDERKEREKKRWLEKPEILQDAAQYLRKNVYDPGWIGTQVPGHETWMETVPPAMMQTYRESENPKLQRAADFGRMFPNAAWNLAQFVGNVGWEGGHALDKMMPTWLGGQDAPIVSKEGKYGLDAWASNKFGWDPYYEDNPYAEKNKDILEGIYDTAGSEADDYWNDILKKNDENEDTWHDGAAKYAEEQLPWAKWQRANPGVSTNEYYKEMTDIYNDRLEDLYGDQYQSVHDNSIKSQMFSEYGFGEKDKSAFADFDFWDYSRALDYSTPEAEEFYKIAEIAPELLLPFGGLSKLKHLKSFRKAPKKEGIMGVKRLEGPKSEYDWAEDWMRQYGE